MTYIVYGCAFSPDGNKIYVSSFESNNLYQYCLNCKESIDSTQQLIYHLTGNYIIAQLQISADGKIYVATPYGEVPTDVFSIKNQNLCVINNPNVEGIACDFDTNTVSLGNRRVILCLPNSPNYNLGALEGSDCDTLEVAIEQEINVNGEISIYPNPANASFMIKGDIKAGDMLNIFSAEGKIIKQILIEKSPPHIDVSHLASGMYVVSVIRNKETIFSEKLFINLLNE